MHRRVAADGYAYTWLEFLEYYGEIAAEMWAHALPAAVLPPVAVPPGPPSAGHGGATQPAADEAVHTCDPSGTASSQVPLLAPVGSVVLSTPLPAPAVLPHSSLPLWPSLPIPFPLRGATLQNLIGALAQPAEPLFDQVALATYTRGNRGPVGDATANEILKRIRDTSAVPIVDLTHGSILDWKGWLRNHTHGSEVVGTGISNFLCQHMVGFNPGAGGNRWDFIALHLDRTAVRLHPHASKKKDPLVYGIYDDWFADSPAPGYRESNNGAIQPVVLLARRHLDSIPQYDYMSKEEVRQWLAQQAIAREDVWQAPSDQTFFQWWRYVANLKPCFIDLLLGIDTPGGIKAFGVGHDNTGKYLSFERSDGNEIRVNVAAHVNVYLCPRA